MSDHTLGAALGARPFSERHIGPDDQQVTEMLKALGVSSLEALMDDAVPDRIRSGALSLPPAASERATAAELREIAAMNNPLVPMIGLGYHGTVTPPVVRRNVLEDPSWYTAYTPYQPEISQGRLEALLNFQTMVSDLTGLTTSNASLLDEGTAAAEAMTLVRRWPTSKANGPFVVDADALPQTIEVVRTRAEAMGIEVVLADLADGLPEGELSGVLVQYPGASGRVLDPRAVIEDAHERGALAVVAADLLALTLLESPGTLGADVAVGSSQRFGVPMFYGGPHAGFMSVRSGLERHLPGRLVGVSVDSAGRPAYRLSLQTREQHIRRDRATSNICTAQVLLAVVASMYAVYHGPDGLTRIAGAVHAQALALAARLRDGGVEVVHDAFFDTVLARVPGRAAAVTDAARTAGVHVRLVDEDHVGLSTSEVTDADVLDTVLGAFGISTEASDGAAIAGDEVDEALPSALRRTTDFLTHEVFNTHRSETSMLRYLRRLSARDYALDRGMIPLGSCTMKLNATTEMEPVSLPGFADLHPFVPAEDALGYRRLIDELESWLGTVTGYDRVSIQPNAGSQGELAGLLAIRAYHQANGEGERRVCLIPSSAHGTNAASAVMAGMKVVVVKSAADGSVDMDDLRAQCEEHRDDLAAIMVTYPSTHGAYEDTIVDLCEMVHDAGGQVYLDGANLNALLGYANPGEFGGDVSHLNLHKTFCIPHGGGGPGVGSGGRARAPGAVPPEPWHAPRGRQAHRHRPDQRSAVRLGRDPADLVGLRAVDGCRGAHPGDRRGSARGELRRGAAAGPLPGALPRSQRPGRARVHPRPARTDEVEWGQRRRRRQAADRLRLPRADDELPGGRHVDGRADRERGPGRAGPVLRGDDRDPRGDPTGRGGGVVPRGLTAARRARTPRRPWSSASRAAPTPPRSRSSRRGPTRTSTGPRSDASTRRTATATWSVPARLPRHLNEHPDKTLASLPFRRGPRWQRVIVASISRRSWTATRPSGDCPRSSRGCWTVPSWPGSAPPGPRRPVTRSSGSGRSPR